jgi:thymidylate synthase (FAD)
LQVKLISYTKGVDDLAEADLNELIAYTARVSNPSNQMNHETSDKLVSYLAKHKHFSPFEMVNVCLEITSTRDIIRQILRHRSFTFQEFSQRYADPTKDMNFELRDARLQDTKNRQNSIEFDNSDIKREWIIKQSQVATLAQLNYKWALDQGIAKEVARSVLPEGMTESKIYMNGSIRSWVHYLMIRTAIETQKEHRDVAVACAVELRKVFPSIDAFLNANQVP